MTPSEIESFLDKQISINENEISRAINEIENKIIPKIDNISVNQDGNISAPSRTLPQARSLITGILVLFPKIYVKAVDNVIKRYSKIDFIINEQFDNKPNKITLQILNELRSKNKEFYRALQTETINRLNAVFIDHVTNGRSQDSLINNVRGALTGHEGIRGHTTLARAKLISEDGLMEYYSTLNLAQAKQAGLDKFLYYGSLIKDSRQWCRDHVGKTYTSKQIAEFDNDRWVGKKNGSTMIVRGGFNCRHIWTAIS